MKMEISSLFILTFVITIFQFGFCQQCDQVDGHGVEVCWNNIEEIQTADGKGIYECLSNSENCIPGARSQYSIFKSLNNEEEFYIFGGEGYDSNENNELLNDLWKVTISTEGNMIYSFIDGSKTNDIIIYSENGTINEYSNDNIIGQRRSSGSFRTENDLCIFGGYGNPNKNSEATKEGSLGDLYCYGINEDNWKFLGGYSNTNSDQFYKGEDWPGQRFDSNTWSYKDENGKWYFYLFGGMTNNYFEDYYSSLFDFWRYDVSNGEWKLMIDTKIFSKIYRTTNYDNFYDSFNRLARPPVTAGGITFQNGNSIYLFGGSADTRGDDKLYNDLWEYSITKEMWRHISGSKIIDDVASANYEGENQIPGGRKFGTGEIFENSFYLFGGNGEDNEGIVGILKDTWKFNFNNNEWKYMNVLPIGDEIDPKKRNGNGRYKSEGDPEYFYPRMGMQSTIIDRKIYFFGGMDHVGSSIYQDTWNLLIEYQCYGFSMSDSEVCNYNGACVGTDSCSCDLGYYGDQCEKRISEGGDNSKTTTDELVVIPITLIAINIVLSIICLLIIGGLLIFVLFRTGKFKALYSKRRKDENIEVEEETKEEFKEKETNSKLKKSKKKKKKKKKEVDEEESFGVARLSFL